MITLTSENILLVGSILIFAAVILSKAGFKFGVPILLLFLIVGMLFGSDGLGLVFDNYKQAQFVGVTAMAVILFNGGMETKFSAIRPVLSPGIVLSTAGVFLTTIFTGLFIFFLARVSHISGYMSIILCFLTASVMSSTDSASVFSILKGNKMKLKENLQPMLELESGSNDPMAYVTLIVLIQAATTLYDPSALAHGVNIGAMAGNAVVTFLSELIIGALVGFGIGIGASWLIQHIHLGNLPLYAILILTFSIFTMAISQMVNGNGYLAVYIAGIIIGNKPLYRKKELQVFLDGMTWIMQLGMFLILGLLVKPHELLDVAPMALLVGLFLIFIGRPLAVMLCLLPFKGTSFRAKVFVSWVGLKGAAPIIFATYPILAGVPGSNQIFNVVFFITLLSLVVQGMSISSIAKWLKLDLPVDQKPETYGIEIPEEAGKMLDYEVTGDDLANGATLKDMKLPDEARVVMIQRNGRFIIPDGSVTIKPGDILILIKTGEA